MPAFGQVFLWLDGALNYSWGLSFMLLYLLPYVDAYLGRGRNPGTAKKVLFVFLAFIAGAYSEHASISTIFIAGYLFILTSVRENRVRVFLLIALISACIGFIFLMTAPSELGQRAGEFNIREIIFRFKYMLEYVRKDMFILYGIYFALFALSVPRADPRIITLSVIMILSTAASLCAFAFARYFMPRHMSFAVIITVAACLMLMSELFDHGLQDIPAAIAGVMSILFIFNFIFGAMDIFVLFKASRIRENEIRQAKEAGITELVLDTYVSETKYSAFADMYDLNTNPYEWPNVQIARYYGLDSIAGK